MREVRIILEEEDNYWLLDEKITRLSRVCNPDDIVELSEEEIKEIKEGLASYEKLQEKMYKLRETRKVKKGEN